MVAKWLCLLFIFIAAAGPINAQDNFGKRSSSDDSDKHSPGVPAGEVLQFTFNHSKIFPGTTRSYWVYIPAAYRADKPACLFVCLDGVQYNAPAVFDSMITKGEMPVTIGVFIQSGTIKSTEGKIIRYNRTNEFDNLNEHFARFIAEEILPDVTTHKASDGRALSISSDAKDRMIAGASSGAICAFTAAWQRPDLFSRVFSAIGTYVGMRGGDQYAVLVRKTEPKPIRVFLQDNDNDTWNPLFGNWFKSNIDMEAALSFAGYEVANMWQHGGHDSRPATAIFPDAMRWLWKGWPGSVGGRPSANDMLKAILDTNETWQPARGVAAMYISHNSAAIMPSGNQYVIKGAALIFQPKGKASQVVDRDGSLGDAVALSPDKQQLVVSIRHSRWLYDYTIGADGMPANKQKLYWLHNPGNDDSTEIHSIAFDDNGNLYAATDLGVQVCDQNGRVRAILSLPAGAVTNLWFGGDGLHTLFVSCGDKLYSRKMRVSGSSWDKTVTPPSQGGG